MIPYYLQNHVVIKKQKNKQITYTIISSSKNKNLEIYYYGDLFKNKYITSSKYPCLIMAKDPKTKEQFVIFDALVHGYDAMFCNEYKIIEERELIKYKNYQGEIEMTLGYNIDYEEEKEEFDFENNNVILKYGILDWEKAKTIGYDWISLKFKKYRKCFLNMELS